MPRFFIDDRPQGELYTLTGENAHHAGRVLRLRPGETLTLCDGAGTDFDCTVEQAEKDEVVCRVQAVHPSETEPRQDMTLFMALPKGDKMDFIVQKAVECGACEVVPFISKRCVSRPDAKQLAKKTERWQRIAYEAAKQCGRGIIPQVGSTIDISKIPALISPENTGILFYECAETPLREAVGEFTRNIDIVIGSEGGFEQSEAEKLIAAGLKCASLGKRILRCETAPIAAISVLMNMTGNM